MESSARVPRYGSPVYQLAIKETFDRLSPRQRLYAHYLARASWHGSRIIMRHVYSESNAIFDFIIELYKSCDGDWKTLAGRAGLSKEELASFLEYAALFLCNIGSYFGKDDLKFVPDLTTSELERLAEAASSPGAKAKLAIIQDSMLTTPPWTLGYPGDNNKSNYYPGTERITRDDIKLVSEVMEKHGVELENTRVSKLPSAEANGVQIFEVYQASSNSGLVAEWQIQGQEKNTVVVRLFCGDHSEEMSHVCNALSLAKQYAENETQAQVIDAYIESFQTGSLEAIRESQQKWVTDISPRVENMIGFVEPYGDHWVRAEWEGLVGISDPVENARMRRVVDLTPHLIGLLPWAVTGINDGKGPFEKELFEAPDFVSLHALAFCSNVLWDTMNLREYNDIGETCGLKNIVIANRLSANDSGASPCPYVGVEEAAAAYNKSASIVRFITTMVGEIVGHRSGKLLRETSPGEYNFDADTPPINPLTGDVVKSWYLPGQTWTSVFGKIATSAEECRGMLVGNVLMDNKELLSIFGHDDDSDITADDLIYHSYVSIGVEGLKALKACDPLEQEWGRPHLRARWAILNHLLSHGNGTMTITHDPSAAAANNNNNNNNPPLTVSVDRSKLLSHGKPALADFLCRLHIWRCTADVEALTEYYERVSAVEGDEALKWRDVVVSSHTKKPRRKFV